MRRSQRNFEARIDLFVRELNILQVKYGLVLVSADEKCAKFEDQRDFIVRHDIREFLSQKNLEQIFLLI